MKRLIVIALVLATGCRNVQKRAVDETSAASTAVTATDIGTARVAGLTANGAPPPATPAPLAKAPNRMIIRNATLSLVVKDAVDVLHKTSALVEAKGGYVAEEHQWKVNDQVRATATLRVPSAQLSPVMATISGYALRVDNQAITGQDVSEEFSDLGAQLKNLQVAETELRELLTTVRKRTEKASEIMEVYNEITRVRGDIERIQGRMQYLSQMTALSTINLDLTPDVLAAPVVEPGWRPLATVRSAARSLMTTLRSLADVGIWVVLYLVPLGLLFVIVALIIRAVWRWLRRQRTEVQ